MSKDNVFGCFCDNYEERKVANYAEGELIVDTCAVSDSDQPYETGILHPSYNDGKWVIVELYNSVEEATAGHLRWVKIMTAKELPKVLEDVSTCFFADLVRTADSMKYERK